MLDCVGKKLFERRLRSQPDFFAKCTANPSQVLEQER